MEYNSIHAAFSSSLLCKLLFFLMTLLIIGAPAFASEASTPFCLFNQSSALLQFKQGINLLPDKLSSWKGIDCCHWEGVTCDSLSGFVTALQIPSVAEGSSSMLDYSLFQLSHLRVLDLHSNGFMGTIPKKLAELTHMTYLDLSNCSFSGEVPTEISHLTRLVYLDLSSNYNLQLENSSFTALVRGLSRMQHLNLNGVNISMAGKSMSTNLSSSMPDLQFLSLSNCNIIGTLVESILQLRSLSYIDLSWNNLSYIPDFFQDFTSLRVLMLANCDLAGFPSGIFLLPKLETLDVSSNRDLHAFLPSKVIPPSSNIQYLDLSWAQKLDGDLKVLSNLTSLQVLKLENCGLVDFPSDIFLLPKLETLDASENSDLVAFLPSKAIPRSSNIQYLDLSGARELDGDLMVLSNLTKLMYLNLQGCAMNGSIPSSWAFKRISELYLSSNNLTGSIPEGICSSSYLTQLYLSGNSLSGKIPSCLFNLSNLVTNDLSENHLSSAISSSHFNLPSIETIDLSDNLLSGNIHSSIFNLPNLKYLYLDDNKLTWEITAAIVNVASSLTELTLSNNMLNGSIPSFLFNLTSLDRLDLSNNKFYGSIPSFFNQYSSLRFLKLGNNCLSGDVPSSISKLSGLIVLDLSSNCFSGATLFPFFNLPYLQLLDFSNNQNLMALESSNSSYSYDSSSLTNNLSILDMSWCKINSFPRFLGNLHYLYYMRLDLSGNDIRGKIPSWFWGIEGLETIFLDNNKIEGFEAVNQSNIDTYSLHFFSAYNNRIAGEIPTFICNNFTELKVLDMSNNNLTSTIPNCLGSIDLSVLGLANNQLRGQIPTFKSSSTVIISFSNNLLSGKIDPLALHNCTNLQVLDMGDNQFNDTFPTWLTSFVNLKVLILRSNRLHGPITLSGSAQEFSSLQIFDISGNHFSGSLPDELFKSLKAMRANESKGGHDDDYGSLDFVAFLYVSSILVESGCPDCQDKKMMYVLPAVVQTFKRISMFLPKISKTMTIIDLSNNMFTNKIPDAIGMLKGLHILNISNNNLSGQIPKSLGNVQQMEALDLSHNHLSGVIPMELLALTFLSVLNLSYNELHGKIPEGNQFNTFDDTSFEGNPSLCGLQVHRPCSISGQDNNGVHQQAFVDKEGDKKEKQWEYGALGFGFAVGILLIALPIVLSERFSRWYWNIIDRVVAFLMQVCLPKASKRSH